MHKSFDRMPSSCLNGQIEKKESSQKHDFCHVVTCVDD